jgi:group I intron endonuclease
MVIYSIYKITNTTNNKSYIGYTYNVAKRIQEHKLRASKPNNYPLYNAIRKHKWNNFKVEIIYQSLDKLHTLNIMEPFFIKEYNTFFDMPNSWGYNLTSGGSSNSTISENTIKIISENTKKQWKNVEFRNAMVEFNRNKWKDINFLKSRTKGWSIQTPEGVNIFCVNLAQYCRDNKLDDGAMISVSKGRRSHHKGYKCRRVLDKTNKM